jgi:hypothetical protein
LGEKWYHSRWQKFGEKNLLYFEATPDYLYLADAPERIAAYNPEMKFICLVRDPVKRAYSAYNMNKFHVANRREIFIRDYFTPREANIEKYFQKMFFHPSGFPSFEEFIKDEMEIISTGDNNQPHPNFIRMGLYLQQFERYYKFFPKDRFIIFENKELENNTARVLDEICRFIGVNPVEWNEELIHKKHGVVEYYDKLNPDTSEMLYKFFKPYNEAFFAHVRKTFEWT